MAETIWTEKSAHWYWDIHDYISADNPSAAVNVVTSIFEKARLLKDHPEIGHKYQTVAGREVRILLYGYYRIANIIRETGDIDILGIFHGVLDIDRYLL